MKQETKATIAYLAAIIFVIICIALMAVTPRVWPKSNGDKGFQGGSGIRQNQDGQRVHCQGQKRRSALHRGRERHGKESLRRLRTSNFGREKSEKLTFNER